MSKNILNYCRHCGRTLDTWTCQDCSDGLEIAAELLAQDEELPLQPLDTNGMTDDEVYHSEYAQALRRRLASFQKYTVFGSSTIGPPYKL